MRVMTKKCLDDLVISPITYGVVKPGGYVSGGVKLIRGGDVSKGKIINELRTISNSISQQYERTILRGGELIISLVGNPGEVALVPKSLAGANLARQVGLVRLSNEVNPKFILYFFMSSFGKEQLTSRIIGSVQLVINLSDLKNVQVTLPPLSEQIQIASILSSLDDKIDLLHRQNKTLKALAETLFRQWFVEEAEEYWEAGKLNDVISVKGGTTPSTTKPEYWNGNINWTSPRDLSNNKSIFLFDTERKISELGLKEIGAGLLPIGSVLLSSRAPIGYLVITAIPVAINQGYIAIICDKLVSNYFIFLWCKANMPDIENAGNGSVFQEISKSTFRTLDFQMPPKDKLKMFDKEVEPMFKKIKSNTIQINTLTQLRDTLLPKLMSGEIKINL